MDNGRNLLTHSRMQCFKTCSRKELYAYVYGIRRERDSDALHWGRGWHLVREWRGQGISLDNCAASLRQLYADEPAWVNNDNREAWLVECECILRLMYGYDWYWGTDDMKVIACEQTFELPIRNPETGAATPTYRIAGKVDKIVQLADGRLAVKEYKTTGDPIAPDSDYWKRTRLDQQLTLYFWAARELGHDIEDIIFDATHRPGMRPLQATPPEKRKYKKDGKLYASQRECNEPIEEFGDRLTADIEARPQFYFQRQLVPRLKADIDEFLHELWQQQKAMRQAELTNRYYRNTGACTSPYRCEYLDICHGCAEIANGVVPEGFKRLDYVHPELEERDNADRTSETPAGATTAANCDCNACTDTDSFPG